MTAGRDVHGPFLAVALVAGGTWCVVATRFLGGDPMVLLEAPAVAVLSVWLSIVGRNLYQARRLSESLRRRSHVRQLAGFKVQVIADGGSHAFVLGALSPTIFVGDHLCEVLDDGELTAVLLHEEHHRRTRAPLRGAALEAWLALVGRWPGPRELLTDRMADLERLADRYAMARGSSPETLASALLKGSPAPAAAAFSYAAERRIVALLEVADGDQRDRRPLLPYEWLPVALSLLGAVGCHAVGLWLLA